MIEKYSEGCWRLRGRTITQSDVDVLLKDAPTTELKRSRICVHYDNNDVVQEMFVLMMPDSYKGTYKCQRASSKYLLHGRMNIEFLSEGGAMMEIVGINENKPFIKIEADVWHRPIILSDYVLLHEIHAGPWNKEFFTTRKPRGG